MRRKKEKNNLDNKHTIGLDQRKECTMGSTRKKTNNKKKLNQKKKKPPNSLFTLLTPLT